MKYRKPTRDIRLEHGGNFVTECVRFVDSLPSEFEILGPGEAAVKWPGGWTREYLLRSSRGDYGNDISLRAWLEALADIAPERKKRRVNLWKSIYHDKYAVAAMPHDWLPGPNESWRKVAGPIEIDD